MVNPALDPYLDVHIEKAIIFSSAGANREERVGLLFQYVDSLNRSESERNEVYKKTGEIDESGNEIYEAYLGNCLQIASACRELSAFLQLLMATEGVETNLNICNNSQCKHAWLDPPGKVNHRIDPMQRNAKGFSLFDTTLTKNLSRPKEVVGIDWGKYETAAYNTNTSYTFIGKKISPTLRDKANENLEQYNSKRAEKIESMKTRINSSEKLRKFLDLGYFNIDKLCSFSLERSTAYLELLDRGPGLDEIPLVTPDLYAS